MVVDGGRVFTRNILCESKGGDSFSEEIRGVVGRGGRDGEYHGRVIISSEL